MFINKVVLFDYHIDIYFNASDDKKTHLKLKEMPEDDELFDNKKQPETAKSSDCLHFKGVRILNSNLSLKIRTKEGSFRVLSHIVQNLNSKMAQAHLNPNLL